MFCGRRRAGIQPNGVETLERRAPPTTKRAPDRRTYRLKIPVSVHLWALGRRLQADLLKRVESEPNEPQVLPLDFAGVEAASASFLRESVVGFCKALRARRSRYYPIVANAPESVLEDLALLSERGEPLLACELTLDGALRRPRLIGDLDPKQKLAFELVCRLGEADAREVCTAHGEWDGQGPVPNYWNNRLAALVEQGLLMELPHGRSKRYRPVVEGDLVHG